MRKLAIMVAAAMTLTGVSRAAEQPKDFAYGLPINAPAGDAFYRLEVPSAVYGKTTRSDLGDLRVFNGADEVVPHAYLPQPPAERVRGTPVDLGLFALTGDAARGVDGVNLRIDSNGERTTISVVSGASNPAPAVSARLLGYVLDGSAIDTPLTSLKLRLPESGASLATKVSLEASDDLKSWRNVARDVPIVRLDSVGGAGTLRLVQDEIVFGATKAKYWRLAWLGKPVELHGVRGSPGDAVIEATRQWRELSGEASAADRPGEYAFDAQGMFPVDRLKIGLPQQNTVVAVQMLVRAQPRDPWRQVATSTVYRLLQDGQEVTSPEITITMTTDRYWLLRLDQRGGGTGSGVPTLGQGWRAHQVVFAARGAPPFQLAYGSRAAQPTGLPIASLIPDWNDAKPERAAAIRVAIIAAVTSPDSANSSRSANGASAAPRTLGGDAVLKPAADVKTWILWAVLVVAVGVLGAMAAKLIKQMGKRP